MRNRVMAILRPRRSLPPCHHIHILCIPSWLQHQKTPIGSRGTTAKRFHALRLLNIARQWIVRWPLTLKTRPGNSRNPHQIPISFLELGFTRKSVHLTSLSFTRHVGVYAAIDSKRDSITIPSTLLSWQIAPLMRSGLWSPFSNWSVTKGIL